MAVLIGFSNNFYCLFIWS